MEADSRNIQNDFFNTARKERTPVTVFLASGKKLVGRIKSFDKFTILLDSHYGEQIIYKHAISTVSLVSRTAASQTAPEGQRGTQPEEPDPTSGS
jgi:host factor-I protein